MAIEVQGVLTGAALVTRGQAAPSASASGEPAQVAPADASASITAQLLQTVAQQPGQTAPTQTIDPMMLAAAARQGSLAPLLADLAQAVESGELPPPVQAAAARVLSLQTPIDPSPSAADIRQALSRSGVLLEARLAPAAVATDATQVSAPPPDLKSALLVLRQALGAWLPEEAAPPRPPARPATTNASPARTPTGLLPAVEEPAATAGQPQATTSPTPTGRPAPPPAASTAETPAEPDAPAPAPGPAAAEGAAEPSKMQAGHAPLPGSPGPAPTGGASPTTSAASSPPPRDAATVAAPPAPPPAATSTLVAGRPPSPAQTIAPSSAAPASALEADDPLLSLQLLQEAGPSPPVPQRPAPAPLPAPAGAAPPSTAGAGPASTATAAGARTSPAQAPTGSASAPPESAASAAAPSQAAPGQAPASAAPASVSTSPQEPVQSATTPSLPATRTTTGAPTPASPSPPSSSPASPNAATTLASIPAQPAAAAPADDDPTISLRILQEVAPPPASGRATQGSAPPPPVADPLPVPDDADAGHPLAQQAAPTPGAANSPPPPPFRGGPTTAQPPSAPGLPAGADAPSVVLRLLHETGAALARQELLQLASMPEQHPPGAGVADQQGPRWSFEIPFTTPQGSAIAQFEISRDGGGGSAQGEHKAVWRARFSLNLEPLGPVHAEIALMGERAGVALWAERPESLAQLNSERASLDQAFRDVDLTAEVALHPGAPRRAAPAAGRFINQAT